ncbi:MAG: alcohol dehydrogenase [Betaproteobacteria bacterium TMED156]|nr:MAG: alcohol dehydrogenase [Betaproteobacteria bacterium TMED156]|tara:strand:+ start:107 stop:1084 length:978 start_codon:yes stop_codon:yes gene_type:complete
MYKAILLKDKESNPSISSISIDDLPEGNVTVRIDYSTINYKDSLALVNKIPIIRKFPMVPGIDFVGTVIETDSLDYSKNQKVILNGWGVGESHWGGLSQIARVSSNWLIPLPKNLSPKQAMTVGTAGYTAMLCVMKLEKHGIHPADGKVLVTGATGGVGSIAIALLSHKGYEVAASTGKATKNQYLENLGVSEIIDRSELISPHKALDKQKWSAVIDTLGSKTLVNSCATTKANGAVIACGNAQGMDFASTVAPFILRGITLYGINSVSVEKQLRIEAWNKLSAFLTDTKLNLLTHEIKLEEVSEIAKKMLSGLLVGRFIVNVNT